MSELGTHAEGSGEGIKFLRNKRVYSGYVTESIIYTPKSHLNMQQTAVLALEDGYNTFTQNDADDADTRGLFAKDSKYRINGKQNEGCAVASAPLSP